MFARVRAFSTISSVVRAPAATPMVASAVQSATPKEKNQSIETATLELLTATAAVDKSRLGSEAIQRYQKIHHEGDIYHPLDLNDALYQDQLRQRRGKPTPTEDPFDALGLDPLHEYKNFRLLASFVSDMGKILPRTQTGVSAKNQRKLAKAIKRARAMGFMSSTNNQCDFRI